MQTDARVQRRQLSRNKTITCCNIHRFAATNHSVFLARLWKRASCRIRSIEKRGLQPIKSHCMLRGFSSVGLPFSCPAIPYSTIRGCDCELHGNSENSVCCTVFPMKLEPSDQSSVLQRNFTIDVGLHADQNLRTSLETTDQTVFLYYQWTQFITSFSDPCGVLQLILWFAACR
jgi:hypothetical protein